MVSLPLNIRECVAYSTHHFVKTDKVSRVLAQVFNDLFARRQESDYLDFVQLEADQVQPWIAGAEQLVEHVASLLEGHGE
jgi:uncharacterized protein (UPF0332 family)